MPPTKQQEGAELWQTLSREHLPMDLSVGSQPEKSFLQCQLLAEQSSEPQGTLILPQNGKKRVKNYMELPRMSWQWDWGLVCDLSVC